jgi:PhoPQ-activated pathogenicity-related protein
MEMNDTIWTKAALVLLFEQLSKFEAHRLWSADNTPVHPGDDAMALKYRRFLEAFAIVIGANSADAVQVAINIATTKMHNSRKALFVEAALRAGFITADEVEIANV